MKLSDMMINSTTAEIISRNPSLLNSRTVHDHRNKLIFNNSCRFIQYLIVLRLSIFNSKDIALQVNAWR